MLLNKCKFEMSDMECNITRKGLERKEIRKENFLPFPYKLLFTDFQIRNGKVW